MLKWEQIDKGWRIWNFTFLSVIFKWHGGSERVKYQEWVKDSRPCWGGGGGACSTSFCLCCQDSSKTAIWRTKSAVMTPAAWPQCLGKFCLLPSLNVAWHPPLSCVALSEEFWWGRRSFPVYFLIWHLASLFSLPQAPARAMYMLWVNILGPWFFAEAPEQQADDKKAKKMERKMKRLQQR